MPTPRHLTFANVTSCAALVVALTGSGVAVAGTLGKNTVGSKQVKNSALRGVDVRDDSVGGADVLESSLAKVPSAATADRAASAASAGSATNSADVLRAVVRADGTVVAAQSERAVSSTGGGGVVTVRSTATSRRAPTC